MQRVVYSYLDILVIPSFSELFGVLKFQWTCPANDFVLIGPRFTLKVLVMEKSLHCITFIKSAVFW